MLSHHQDTHVSEKITQCRVLSEKVSEYDQEIPQSQTADNPVAPRGRAAQSSHQEDKLSKAISSLFPIKMLQY